MRRDVDEYAAKVFVVALLPLVVGMTAVYGCAVSKLSPATQEALVVDGLALLRDRCSVLFANGEPPASEAKNACMVLAAIDRGLMVLEPRTTDDGPVSGDGGPAHTEQGNAVRAVDGGP